MKRRFISKIRLIFSRIRRILFFLNVKSPYNVKDACHLICYDNQDTTGMSIALQTMQFLHQRENRLGSENDRSLMTLTSGKVEKKTSVLEVSCIFTYFYISTPFLKGVDLTWNHFLYFCFSVQVFGKTLTVKILPNVLGIEITEVCSSLFLNVIFPLS